MYVQFYGQAVFEKDSSGLLKRRINAARVFQTAFSFHRRVRPNGFFCLRNQPVRLVLNEQKCRLKPENRASDGILS
ncbi:hypothetical protein KEM39_09385 [Neisseria sp. Marseille-Q1983]|nr:hypothetical protein [Neisseria sp. Marseille-Q1983]